MAVSRQLFIFTIFQRWTNATSLPALWLLFWTKEWSLETSRPTFTTQCESHIRIPSGWPWLSNHLLCRTKQTTVAVWNVNSRQKRYFLVWLGPPLSPCVLWPPFSYFFISSCILHFKITTSVSTRHGWLGIILTIHSTVSTFRHNWDTLTFKLVSRPSLKNSILHSLSFSL